MPAYRQETSLKTTRKSGWTPATSSPAAKIWKRWLWVLLAGGRFYLRDVAEKIVDGAADPANYVVYGTTNSGTTNSGASAARQYPAVTITVAKRKGTNATDIANAVLKSVHRMQGVTIPTT